MKRVVGILLAGTAGILVCGATAKAADILETPIYQGAPELQPVEVGSGWYLRGDVSYDLKSDIDTDYTVAGFGGGFDGSAGTSLDLKDGFGFGGGIGYRITDYLRTDVTLHYWKHDVSDLAAGPVGLSPELQTYELMANAYADLGTFAGFTPYVGAGAGMAHTHYDVTCVDGAISCGGLTGVSSSNDSDWRFAYALMAGVSYDVTRNLKLDAGYRYVNVAGGDTATLSASRFGNPVSVTSSDDGYDRHTFQLGLRYEIW